MIDIINLKKYDDKLLILTHKKCRQGGIFIEKFYILFCSGKIKENKRFMNSEILFMNVAKALSPRG